jgi:biopolymer transport protein ExbD
MKFNIPVDPIEEEVQMAPMIDMVFLLVIFFMTASHFNQMDNPSIDLPVADKAAVPKDVSDRRSITVKQDGVIFVGNAPTPLEKIGPMIEDLRKKVPGLKVYVRAEELTPFKAVKDVMKVCAEAGAAEVIFATYETEGS